MVPLQPLYIVGHMLTTRRRAVAKLSPALHMATVPIGNVSQLG